MELLEKWINGNSLVEISNDGTRIITTEEDDFDFEYPLNIDIRVSSRCMLGLNPVTNKAFCDFCHESAKTNGTECDYDWLLSKLEGLPRGIELAVGLNEITENTSPFLEKCKENGWIVNVTVNHVLSIIKEKEIVNLMLKGLIKGLGLSYRSKATYPISQYLLSRPNTVVHVINGLDDLNEILSLKSLGAKKILVLGEKDFGFNKNKVNLDSPSHKNWHKNIGKLFKAFDIVSFDNLALEQLNLKNRLDNELWEERYQGEFSIYINAVEKYFSPSSRSDEKDFSEISIKEYFQQQKAS